MKLAALLPILPLAGCAPSWPDDYELRIDPSFSVSEQAAIVRAADNWTVPVPGLRLDVLIAPCPSDDDGQRICVAPAWRTQEDGVRGETRGTWGLFGRSTERVALYADHIQDGEWEGVAAHELGHAMGLVHDVPGTLMCRAIGCMADHVTPSDVAQWHRVRE